MWEALREDDMEQRSSTVALLLALGMPFLGVCGAQRLYSGHVFLGLVYLFTGGLCGLGQLYDIIMILVGAYSDCWGRPLV